MDPTFGKILPASPQEGSSKFVQDYQLSPTIQQNFGTTEMQQDKLSREEHKKPNKQTTIEVENDPGTVELMPPSQPTNRHQAAQETILNKLCKEVENLGNEGEVYTDSCCDKCSNCFCQSCNCSSILYMCRHCTINHDEAHTTTELLETEALRKGRAQGSKDFADAVFPLVPDTLRLLWVIIEFSLAAAGLALSVLTTYLDQNRAFNILHLALYSLACALAGVDSLYNLKNSTTLRKCCCCCGFSQRRDRDGQDMTGCKQKCCSRLTHLLDILRLILSEAILYPLLICDIFELTTGKGFKGDSTSERLSFALFILSLVSMFLTVYLARIIVLVWMIKNATAVRSPSKKMIDADIRGEKSYDPDIKRSAVCYQVFFFLHAVFQMFMQLLMYVLIAAKIRFENRHFYEDGNSDGGIRVTIFLWYMMAAAYVLPTMGLFTFFITTYYWSQQYLVGYRLDMISIFKMTEYGMVNLPHVGKEIRDNAMFTDGEVKGRRAKIMANMDRLLFKPLKDDFEVIFSKRFLVKFLYPFKTPMLIIVCLVYSALQFAFVVCASLAVDEMGVVVIHILNGGGWVYYYIAAVAVGVIANIYTFVIAAVWTPILIVTAIAIIAVVVSAIIALVVLVAVMLVTGIRFNVDS